MVDLGATFSGPRAGGQALVDGVFYPQIYVDGMTGTFSSPLFRISGTETVTVSIPFSYSGVVTGYLMDPWVHGTPEPVFTKALLGQGTATARFIYTFYDEDGPLFTADDLRYDFAEAAPVPEPATMLLFGAGSAVLALRRRRQLQKNRGRAA
jgi:hypothetical protein